MTYSKGSLIAFTCILLASSATQAQRQREDVVAEAIAAASAPDPYADSASAKTLDPLLSPVDRAVVQREAVVTSHAPNQNLEPGSFLNSMIPAQFNFGADVTRFANESTPAIATR